jgi:hypothetical protein
MGLGGLEMSQTTRTDHRHALYRDFSFRCSIVPRYADKLNAHSVVRGVYCSAQIRESCPQLGTIALPQDSDAQQSMALPS